MLRRPQTFRINGNRFRTLAVAIPLSVALAVASIGIPAQSAKAQELKGLFNLGDLVGKPAPKSSSSEAKITLEPASAKAGDVVTVKVALDLPEGSYSYSMSKGFSGRTKFEIKTSTGVEPVDADFVAATRPKSKNDSLLGQVVETHEGNVVWTRRFRVKAGASPEFVRIAGDMRYQVCDATSCRPKNQKFDLSLGSAAAPVYEVKHAPTRKVSGVEKPGPSTWTARLSPKDAAPGEKVTLAIVARMEKGYHTFAVDHDKRNIGLPTTIQTLVVSGLKPVDAKAQFRPDHKVELHEVLGKTQRIHHDEVTWTREFVVADSAKADGYGVSGKVSFQVCDARSCRTGKFSFELGQLNVGSQNAPDNPSTTAVDGSTESSATSYKDSTGLFENLRIREPGREAAEIKAKEASLSTYLLYAFLGGLILNVMPCVLPVIAIKVMSFVQQAGEHRGRILMLNASYAAGVIGVFLLLATLAAFAQLTWGGQFQQIEFRVAMIAMVFVMGLSLLGVFELPIPGFSGSSNGQHKEGLTGAFMTGVFATILATPCSGPFLGPIFTWSFSQPAIVIYAVWIAMGLGMASPYLLFGLFPAAVKYLPKPGNWMIRFKQIAGLIMMATTVFLISILNEEHTTPILVMLLGLSTGAWMVGNLYDLSSPRSHRFRIQVLSLFVAGCICGYGYWLTLEEEGWAPFSPRAVAAALDDGRPVIIDFTADWCVTCKVMEFTTLETEITRQAVQRDKFVTLKADWTDESEEIRYVLEQLGATSIPTLAVFSPAKPNEPIVLRDAWSQSTLIEQLETVVSENEQAAVPQASLISTTAVK